METNNNPGNLRADLLEQILAEETKQAKASRVRMILSFVSTALLLALVVALIVTASAVKGEVHSAVGTLTQTAANLDEVANELKAVDFKGLESSCLELAESGTTAMNGIADAIEKIDGLEDMAQDTLQSAGQTLASVAEALEYVNSVDIESLNGGIEKLNDILTTLDSFLSLFGKRG